jgi:DNA polymerase-3 subunit alpha
MPQFVHLHNHSHYSLLDGACTIDALVEAAVENNMPALALTDHGVMFGAIEFYKKATRAGIKPIIGTEAYIVTDGSRFDRITLAQSRAVGKGRGIYHHIVLLAKNYVGYKNLIKLVTLAHTEGFYYKPRIDLDLLQRYSEGLVALSACPNGVVAAQITAGDLHEAKRVASLYKNLFDGDFYLEIQNHGLEREKPILEWMPKLAAELGIKLVGTNDVHYVSKEHALAHNVLLLIPEASIGNPPDYTKLKYGTDQLYFKSAAEMTEALRENPTAIENTLEIAEKCDLVLQLRQNHMPNFHLPEDIEVKTLDDYLDLLAKQGLQRRYEVITSEIEARLEHELGVIKKMGYSGYFLIVQDFIRAAKEKGVRVGPGRGSAAGSLVSYALGITDVDPLQYGLLFERFLNPDRVTMPDIDVDFADDKRELVIDYVRRKYGAESVSQIITFGTLLSRAVLKDVGRVLGVSLGTIESITKQIPVLQGRVTRLAEALETIPELRWVKDTKDEKIRQLIDISLVLEGLSRNASTHAAGIVIAPGPIDEYVPLYKTPQTEPMTQYNMKDLEEAGLLKMDLLGLRTLSVFDLTLSLIKQTRGVEIDLTSIPLDDPKTFELFSRGATVGVFQFENPNMQDYLRKLQPNSISDLVAMNALNRPGPMDMIDDFIARKHGKQRIEYLHPLLEPILKETYGIIVYQEQVIKITSEIAGFTLAKADLMRRAMGKKDKSLMADLKKEFVAGATQRGIQRKVAAEIFDLIEKFASYGFNKSHSVAYSIIAYQTAYLKTHYPAEFMAAILTSEIGNTDKIVLFINDCRKSRLNVLPPDVNESESSFVVTHEGLRFGLSAVKNVGEGAVESIVQERKKSGPFLSLFDFCRRVDLRIVNRKTIESLIQAGAFDTLEANRARLFEGLDKALSYAQNYQTHAIRGQSSLFDSLGPQTVSLMTPHLPEVPEWPEAQKLDREKAMLGFYVSGHPLLKFEEEVNVFSTAKLGQPELVKPGAVVRVCGIVTAIRKKTDKKGNMMAFVTMEDFTGHGECIVFSEAYKQFEPLLHQDSMVMVVGKGEGGGTSLRVLVQEVHPLDKVRERFTKSIVVSIRIEDTQEQAILELRKLMEKHRGNCVCYFNVLGNQGADATLFSSKKYVVQPSNEFMLGLERILGPHCVKINA